MKAAAPAADGRVRCSWCLGSPLERDYHDGEWGTPCHDDRKLFEFLVLEGAQAGLSWRTVLLRRERYRAALDGFDPMAAAASDEARIEDLMQDQGLIRNRLKLRSVRSNAQAFLAVQQAFGSFDAYLWNWVDGRPVDARIVERTQAPTRTELSDRVSRDLRRRGFSFVGTTIVYAYLQAVGLVNGHVTGCFRHAELRGCTD